jgi:group I intron endonuclease
MIGIYKIESYTKPERVYIGSSIDIDRRWYLHIILLKEGKHPNKKLQHHFNKYKELDLKFSILLGCDENELLIIEQFFIDAYNPWFNICKKAYSHLGTKRSQESIEKMRKAKQNMSEETKQKIRDARKRQSPPGLGKKLSEEYKLQRRLKKELEHPKIIKVKVKKVQIPWNKGKKLGYMPPKAFKKGQIPWNKGIKQKEYKLKNLKQYL